MQIIMFLFCQVVKVGMRDINSHIVCSLCAGYFVDATAITECLHICKYNKYY